MSVVTKVVLDGEGTLQQQICRGLKTSILSGSLKADSRLAPTRVFAETYGVSRNTVIAAFDQLCAEGYLVTRQGSGTYVAPAANNENHTTTPSDVLEPNWSRSVQRLISRVPDHMLLRHDRARLRYDFLYGEPSYTDLPLEKWSRTVGRCARELTESQLGYGPAAGLPALREALAEYLGRARGVVCETDQIFITHGTQEAIDLVMRAFTNEGESVVLEEPHYRGFMRCALAAGANVYSISVDESGIDTDCLSDIEAKVAFVTPSHQFPVGGVMSLARRMQLLRWAKQNQTVVFEDDYDGEFRYEARPIPSLQSLDDAGQVIYAGTASKMLFPSLRLGWMVVPKQMVPVFERLRLMTNSCGPVLEQLAFADFIKSGHLERYIHKARRIHQQRREMLLATLMAELGDQVVVTGAEAGIHVLVQLPGIPGSRTEELIDKAAEQQVGVYPSAIYYVKKPRHVELLLGYAALSPQQIRTGVKRLAKVIVELARR